MILFRNILKYTVGLPILLYVDMYALMVVVCVMIVEGDDAQAKELLRVAGKIWRPIKK